MTDIANALAQVRQRIKDSALAAHRNPTDIQLLAVSKTKPAAMIREAFDAGQRAFGENYLQDALPKMASLATLDLEWHYIGRIQSNKTAEIAQHFDWVHGIDKLKHAQRLNRQRPPNLPPLQCCIQVNLSGEDSKGGVSPEAVAPLAESIGQLPALQLRGLMTMPNPNTPKAAQAKVFTELAALKDQLKQQGQPLDTLSMGMSGDLELAIAAGSTLVRIGTDIFGARQAPLN